MITTLPGDPGRQAGIGRHAAARHRGRGPDRGRRGRRHRAGLPRDPQAVAVDAAHALQGGRALRRDVLGQVRARHLLRGRRRAPRRGRLLLDHRARRRRHQRLRPPALDGRGRVSDRLAREGRRGGRDRAAGRGHGPGDHRVRDALRHAGGRRRADRRHPRARRQADRQAGPAQARHLGRRPAQDPLREDHAPAAARHRRGPRAGRRDDAPRPGRHVAAREQDQGAQAGRRSTSAPEGEAISPSSPGPWSRPRRRRRGRRDRAGTRRCRPPRPARSGA